MVFARGARVWDINWLRVARKAALIAVPSLAAVLLAAAAMQRSYGADFRVGIWPAGADMLRGHSPYPAPDPHRLFVLLHGFIMPPPVAVLAAPFSLLPFPAAIALWNIMCVGALGLALAVMGIRDKRIYLLALCSFPMWESLQMGQPDAVFALLAALTWRYRDSSLGGVAAGALIAAKLLAWPLLIWMLVTRRFRSFAVAVGSAIVILLGSWAMIGFRGLGQYASLLAADAKAFETFPLSYSLVEALSPLDLPIGASRALAVAIALAVAVAIIAFARRADEGWFAAALTFGVLSSPLLWRHYMVVLFVPLAFARRRQLEIWIATAYSFWVALLWVPTAAGRAAAIVVVMVALLGWAIWSLRQTSPGRARSPVNWAQGVRHLRRSGALQTPS